MAITRRPTGSFKLVWLGDEAISDRNAARVAKRLYVRDHDPSVFTADTLIAGGELVVFHCAHLTRGALDYIDTFMSPHRRQTAAFKVGVTALSGPGTEDLAVKTEKAAWGGKIMDEDSLDRIYDALPTACIYEIGDQVLAAALFGDPEKKASSPPSGSQSSERKES